MLQTSSCFVGNDVTMIMSFFFFACDHFHIFNVLKSLMGGYFVFVFFFLLCFFPLLLLSSSLLDAPFMTLNEFLSFFTILFQIR